jgi:hypothetical protein
MFFHCSCKTIFRTELFSPVPPVQAAAESPSHRCSVVVLPRHWLHPQIDVTSAAGSTSVFRSTMILAAGAATCLLAAAICLPAAAGWLWPLPPASRLWMPARRLHRWCPPDGEGAAVSIGLRPCRFSAAILGGGATCLILGVQSLPRRRTARHARRNPSAATRRLG